MPSWENAIAPGFIITEQTAGARADATRVRRVLHRTPLDRWGHPIDMAGPALFLASPTAAFVTRVVLRVDEGYTAVPKAWVARMARSWRGRCLVRACTWECYSTARRS